MGNIFNNDFRDFILALNKANVEYILVGGYSVILHGYKRVTGDMDVWVNKTAYNYDKIVRAFGIFGMPVFDMTREKFLLQEVESEVFRFGISPSRIDLMTTVKGLEFDQCNATATWYQDEEIKVKLIHYRQLIEAKEASGRDKDKIDIKNLEEIKRNNV